MPTPSRVPGRKKARRASLGVDGMDNRAAPPVDDATPPGLSDREIVRAAREIIAEVGVDGLTMRLLSAKLGVALGATYHYVATKHDLLVLVGQNLYDEVTYPSSADGDWADQLRVLMLNIAETVSGYPGMGNYMITHPDFVFPAALNRFTTEMLQKAGFTEEGIMVVLTALYFYVSGMVIGSSSPASRSAFDGVDTNARFRDGLDLLLAGARLRLDADRATDDAGRSH
jgi:AcrR family transcriptional regulator